MPVELATAYISLVPSARGLVGGLQSQLGGPLALAGRKAGASASSEFGGTFKKGLRPVGIAAGGILALGLGKVFKDAFGEAEEAAKVGRLTAAVLKSTGGIANVTAGHVDDLSQSLSKVSAVDDEIIASGANVLLTFTKVRNEAGKGNDVFDQATTAALNLSAAFGTDLRGATLQVGKALQDPLRGVSTLTRAGVQFTKQQKAQVKALVETGNTLGAQKVILKELTTQFGGAAKAAATPSERLKVAVGNLEEALGTLLLPVLTKVSNGLATLAGWIERNRAVAVAIIVALTTLVTVLGTMLVITKIVNVVKAFALAMQTLNLAFLANPIVLVVAAIALLGVGFFIAYKKIKPFRDAVDATWQIMQTLFNWVKQNWPLLLAILTGPFGLAARFILQHFDDIKRGISSVKVWIQTKIAEIVNFFKGIPGKIGRAAGDIFSFIRDSFRNAINFVIRGWNSLEFKIPGFDPPGPGPKFGGFTIGLPNIPELHDGGIFNASGGEGFAFLQSGEGVFTKDQMKALGQGRQTIDARVIVNGNVNGVDDLNAWADMRDRKLVAALGAGAR